MNQKYLLCRPQGGLNDMLTQIEWCCRYADMHGRIVIVDTAYAGSAYFKDSFDRYFVPRQSRLWLGTRGLALDFDRMEVLPKAISGRVTRYETRWDDARDCFVDAESGERLSFDATRGHQETLLVHHSAGGNALAQFALLRLRLHDGLVDALLERLRRIPGPYTALHIRNTDYRTDYAAQVAELSRTVRGPVFVATDNRDTLSHCVAQFGPGRVFAFSELPANGGEPIHRDAPDPATARRRNFDAILDLFTLALARRLHALQIANNPRGRYSGFSSLAMKLHETRPMLAGVLQREHPLLAHLR